MENKLNLKPSSFARIGHLFTGKNVSLLLQRQRYDPETGRFTSLDPIRDGLNWYVYCSNNPVNAVDPIGLLSEDDDFPWNDLNYSRTTTPSSETCQLGCVW